MDEESHGGTDYPHPECSIIIPTFRRPRELADCVRALTRLDYPLTRVEVIVVDDGSGIDLKPCLRPFREQLNISLVVRERAGPAGARNAGAVRAHGELLAFTDDDCRPAATWLRLLAEHCAARSGTGAGGHTINALPENPYASLSQLVIDVGYEQNNSDRAAAQFLTTNNLVVPAEGFRLVGGFDARFTTSEDRDFCDRWLLAGLSLSYVPDAVVFHAHRLTWRRFVRQHFAYGRGALRFHAAYRARRGQRVGLSRSFYVSLARAPFRRASGADALKLSVLLQLWNVVNTAGFAWEWFISGTDRRSRREELTPAPAGEPARGATADAVSAPDRASSG